MKCIEAEYHLSWITWPGKEMQVKQRPSLPLTEIGDGFRKKRKIKEVCSPPFCSAPPTVSIISVHWRHAARTARKQGTSWNLRKRLWFYRSLGRKTNPRRSRTLNVCEVSLKPWYLSQPIPRWRQANVIAWVLCFLPSQRLPPWHHKDASQ